MSRPKLALVVALALALAAGLIGASVVLSRDEAAPPAATGTTLPGAEEVLAELTGMPQDGPLLGRPDAPVTMVVYADLQCPFCAQWDIGTLPELVEDYVRPGDLRLEFRGIAFIGPDSERALRAAYAAGLQDRLWHLVGLLYRNQGAENSGWVSDDLLRAAAASVPGLDAEQLFGDLDSDAVEQAIAAAQQAAQRDGIGGTPSFLVGRTEGELERLAPDTLAPEPFREAIERLLGR